MITSRTDMPARTGAVVPAAAVPGSRRRSVLAADVRAVVSGAAVDLLHQRREHT